MTLKPGDPAPDCTFLRADETEVRLSAWAGRPLVLIFLRHVA
jgi:peroxiredoxin